MLLSNSAKNKRRLLIVDDEPIARQRLALILSNSANIEVVGEAQNGIEAIEKIPALQPDIVLLDIEMPGFSGIEVAQQIGDLAYIIFTTAYDQYALDAFDTNAIAYLLKPIEVPKLTAALEKADRILSETRAPVFDVIKSHFITKVGHRIRFIRRTDVALIEAKEKYTYLVLNTGKSHIIDHSLTDLEADLSAPFIRVHRSTIINTDFIQEIEKLDRGRYEFLLTIPGERRIQSGKSYQSDIDSALNL